MNFVFKDLNGTVYNVYSDEYHDYAAVYNGLEFLKYGDQLSTSQIAAYADEYLRKYITDAYQSFDNHYAVYAEQVNAETEDQLIEITYQPNKAVKPGNPENDNRNGHSNGSQLVHNQQVTRARGAHKSLPQTGNDGDLAMIGLGSATLLSVLGLISINRKQHS